VQSIKGCKVYRCPRRTHKRAFDGYASFTGEVQNAQGRASSEMLLRHSGQRFVAESGEFYAPNKPHQWSHIGGPDILETTRSRVDRCTQDAQE